MPLGTWPSAKKLAATVDASDSWYQLYTLPVAGFTVPAESGTVAATDPIQVPALVMVSPTLPPKMPSHGSFTVGDSLITTPVVLVYTCGTAATGLPVALPEGMV